MFGRTLRRSVAFAAAALLISAGAALAAPGDIVLSDDFDDGAGCSALSPTWTVSDTNLGGISTQTSNSGNCSMFTRGDVVTITSPVYDLSAAVGVNLTAWLRQGLDTFSEDVDDGEDFVFEYLNAGGSWIAIDTLLGSGTNGGVTNIDLDLPSTAFHSGFQLRFRQTGGSGGPPANGGIGYDYWHIDDVLLVETGTAPPPPLPTGLGLNRCEEFESGFGNWSTTNATRSGINGDTFDSSSNSMYLRHNAVTTTSISFDSNNLAEIQVWVREGADTFSENPEAGENLTFQYLNASNNWITLETFFAGGAQGDIFDRTYTMPASSWHANFRVRFSLNTGSGSDFDYWHIDDLCFVQATPDFDVQKSVVIEQDPINGTTNPLGIPGAWAIYSITVTNNGAGAADIGTMQIGDMIDDKTTLFTGDFDGFGSPFEFIDGVGADASGLTLDFGGLGDGTDGVVFRNSGGTSIVPSGGFDTNVARFDLAFDGAMNGTSGGGTPTFTLRYRVLVD